ncbi:MAG: DUF1365 domain-containing protein [Planctomycetota bacterium]
MSLNSAIYSGHIQHRRFAPVRNAFRYPLYMMYLDLSELDDVFAMHPLYSRDRANAASLQRRDHFGADAPRLDQAVRDLVAESGAARPSGPIRLLTHLRYWGHCFNPVSFYYCFDRAGEQIETIVAEVSNTPWHERYCYVLPAGPAHRRGPWLRFGLDKRFDVSPFMSMDQQYDWRFRPPGATLGVYMQNFQDGRRLFDAKLTLRRRELTRSSMTAALVRYPLMTVKVVAAIHFQALRLFRKGAPFYVHPKKRDLREGANR